MEAHRNQSFRCTLEAASLSLPDGMPLVWLGRFHGKQAVRVAGPDLMLDICAESESKGYRHFFYGGAPGVAEELVSSLKERYPALQVVGVYSPPFRTLTEEEDDAAVEMINHAAPHILWIGLGCPKQEQWMCEHRNRLKVAVMLGIGQALDIHAGRLHRAPRWMRDNGLEWLFRLLSEPRRLWRRYLFWNTRFIWCLLLEVLDLERLS